MYRLNPLDSTAGVDDLIDFSEFELNPAETKNRQYKPSVSNKIMPLNSQDSKNIIDFDTVEKL